MLDILEYISSLFQFILTQIQTLIWFVTVYLPQSAAAIATVQAFSPTFIAPFISLSLGLTLIFAVIRLI